MTDKTVEQRLDELVVAHAAALIEMRKELESLKQGTADQTQQALTLVGARLAEFERQQKSAIAEIEKIAIYARAVMHSAEAMHESTRAENRVFYANFKKIGDHHADMIKRLYATLEQDEKKAYELVVEANQRIAEHQATAERFNRTTRGIALVALVLMVSLLAWLDRSWFISWATAARIFLTE